MDVLVTIAVSGHYECYHTPAPALPPTRGPATPALTAGPGDARLTPGVQSQRPGSDHLPPAARCRPDPGADPNWLKTLANAALTLAQHLRCWASGNTALGCMGSLPTGINGALNRRHLGVDICWQLMWTPTSDPIDLSPLSPTPEIKYHMNQALEYHSNTCIY